LTEITASTSESTTFPYRGDIGELQDAFLSKARDRVMEKHGFKHEGGDLLISEVYFEALKASLDIEDVNRTLQVRFAVDVGRRRSWEHHPDGYNNLYFFLKGAGVHQSTASKMAFIGEYLAPFCDHYSIPLDLLLTEEHQSKLKQAVPVLRDAVADDAPEDVVSILKDVKKARGRKAISKKYAKKRNRYGHGTTQRLPDGRAVVVLVMDNDPGVGRAVEKLGGMIEWDLVATGYKTRGSVQVVINDPPGDSDDE